MSMHTRMFVTFNCVEADSSEAARQHVYDALFEALWLEAGDLVDWFVIGGRWSGTLSAATWANAACQEIERLEDERHLLLRGATYFRKEDQHAQAQLLRKAERRYAKAVPPALQGKGLTFDRDASRALGYEDDAMVVTQELYDAFLKSFENTVPSTDHFVDFDDDVVSPAFIGSKWLVVVDYHS
jgi:hypothetical protein